MTKETDKQVAELLESAKVPFATKFKPTPQPDAKRSTDLQVHWTVTIGKEEFSYQTGIGHLPKRFASLANSKMASDFGTLRTACEMGLEGLTLSNRWHKRPETHPTAASVLYCLLSDSDALDSPTFESWASDLGYDTDSRKAEQIYRACIENGLKLRRVLGESNMVKLRERLEVAQ